MPEHSTPTPGHTIGPFFGYALPYPDGPRLVPPGRPGTIRLHGTVRDGRGAPVPDAMLEIWQADETGGIASGAGSIARDGHTFTGWARAGTDRTGRYSFSTVNPGHIRPGSARFIALVVFARGLLNRLFTRVYLPEDTAAMLADPLLSSLEEDRRATLLAEREPGGDLRFDIHLQGERETVFLTYPRHQA